MAELNFHIGIIYYSQTGQLTDIANKFISGFPNSFTFQFLRIIPERVFPFPWTSWEFFDAMPESVLGEGTNISIEGYHENLKFDLIILAFQPWFLSPSIPFMGFLNSNEFRQLVNNRDVITLIGARNMWLNAQEKVKSAIAKNGGNLIANIPFVDSNPNLISTLTVIRWAFKGQKHASKWLPEAGVQKKELDKASTYGRLTANYILNSQEIQLQQELINIGAIGLKPGLILLEQTGIKNFRKFARMIKDKGEPLSASRKSSVMLFKNILITGIFIISPIKAVISRIQLFLKRKKLAKDLIYFQSVEYKSDMI